MSTTSHLEKHFTGSAVLRDIVIGMSDGLTVPFALAAGLSGALASSQLVITAGLAEVAAGAIAMGLGGYLASRTEAEHFQSERAREERETIEIPEEEAAEVRRIFQGYGLSQEALSAVVNTIRSDRKRWVDFMMRFELGLEEPDKSRAFVSAFTIAISYIAGGLVPLLPYFFIPTTAPALPVSIALTLLALFIFGFVKGKITTRRGMRGALQMLIIGSLAAGAAFFIARLVSF